MRVLQFPQKSRALLGEMSTHMLGTAGPDEGSRGNVVERRQCLGTAPPEDRAKVR
ncbi:hypothetical protein P7K49_023829 [Saguinus oedipus]|uniref:Uncharacterized protein n=1 Tax=Saguinus oedipus TaxID=9490 RepID=A0ABQ9UPG9_SAGOE|nr:hypothetical protein P7K49_023829 [Saguinus oedipus]